MKFYSKLSWNLFLFFSSSVQFLWFSLTAAAAAWLWLNSPSPPWAFDPWKKSVMEMWSSLRTGTCATPIKPIGWGSSNQRAKALLLRTMPMLPPVVSWILYPSIIQHINQIKWMSLSWSYVGSSLFERLFAFSPEKQHLWQEVYRGGLLGPWPKHVFGLQWLQPWWELCWFLQHPGGVRQ